MFPARRLRSFARGNGRESGPAAWSEFPALHNLRGNGDWKLTEEEAEKNKGERKQLAAANSSWLPEKHPHQKAWADNATWLLPQCSQV